MLGPADEGVTLKETGCIGLCHREVLVEIVEDGRQRTLYGEVTPDRVDRIVADHLRGGRAVAEWVVDREGMLAGQKRIVLRNCGEIDPSRIEEYRARGGYVITSYSIHYTKLYEIEIPSGGRWMLLLAVEGSGVRTERRWIATADGRDARGAGEA